jgi:hypothetical protein
VALGTRKQGQVTLFWQFGFDPNNHFCVRKQRSRGRTSGAPNLKRRGASGGARDEDVEDPFSSAGGGGGSGAASEGPPASPRRRRPRLSPNKSLQDSDDDDLDDNDRDLAAALGFLKVGNVFGEGVDVGLGDDESEGDEDGDVDEAADDFGNEEAEEPSFPPGSADDGTCCYDTLWWVRPTP